MGDEASTSHGGKNELVYQIAIGKELEKMGDEEKIDEYKWNLYRKAAKCYELAQPWNKAGGAYVKMARCCFKHPYLQDRVPNELVTATDCYKKISIEEALICLREGVLLLHQNRGTARMVGKSYMELGELCELEQNFEEAIKCFERSYKTYEHDEYYNMNFGNECRKKVAKLSALLGQYSKAIEIFEEIVKQSVNDVVPNCDNKQMLLNAGLYQLCLGVLLH